MEAIVPQSTDKAVKQILAAREWFASPKGQHLLQDEFPILCEALSYYIGRYILYWGPLETLSTSENYKNDVFSLGLNGVGANIICEERAWPIITESVSAVVLQHSLDFASSPHDLLRESARCVRPGGHLLIAGFNPLSFGGLYKRCCFNILGKSNSISYYKLSDWLRLLGFSIDKHWYGGYSFPFKRLLCKRLFNRLEAMGMQRSLFGCGFYVVSARKLMIQITPDVAKKRFIWGKLTPFPVTNRNDVRKNDRNY